MSIRHSSALKTFRSILLPQIAYQNSNVPLQLRMYAKRTKADPDDEPIKFSTSGAIYGIADIRQIQLDNTPWYQGPIAILSVAIFLFYFCYLREENDIDLEMERSLYERYDGLELTNLQIARKYYLQIGDSREVNKIDARLKELSKSVN